MNSGPDHDGLIRDPRTARCELVQSLFYMSAPTHTEWCVDPWDWLSIQWYVIVVNDLEGVFVCKGFDRFSIWMSAKPFLAFALFVHFIFPLASAAFFIAFTYGCFDFISIDISSNSQFSFSWTEEIGNMLTVWKSHKYGPKSRTTVRIRTGTVIWSGTIIHGPVLLSTHRHFGHIHIECQFWVVSVSRAILDIYNLLVFLETLAWLSNYLVFPDVQFLVCQCRVFQFRVCQCRVFQCRVCQYRVCQYRVCHCRGFLVYHFQVSNPRNPPQYLRHMHLMLLRPRLWPKNFHPHFFDKRPKVIID